MVTTVPAARPRSVPTHLLESRWNVPIGCAAVTNIARYGGFCSGSRRTSRTPQGWTMCHRRLPLSPVRRWVGPGCRTAVRRRKDRRTVRARRIQPGAQAPGGMLSKNAGSRRARPLGDCPPGKPFFREWEYARTVTAHFPPTSDSVSFRILPQLWQKTNSLPRSSSFSCCLVMVVKQPMHSRFLTWASACSSEPRARRS